MNVCDSSRATARDQIHDGADLRTILQGSARKIFRKRLDSGSLSFKLQPRKGMLAYIATIYVAFRNGDRLMAQHSMIENFSEAEDLLNINRRPAICAGR